MENRPQALYLSRVPSPTDTEEMSDFVGAIALIRQIVDGKTSWLLREDGVQHRFIQTDRIEGESYRDAIQREVAWQLELDPKKHFIVSSVPRLHYQSPMQTPVDDDEVPSTKACSISPEQDIHWMIVQFFVVDLFGKAGRDSIAANESCHWWTTAEILAGTKGASTQLNPLQQELIRVSEVISPVDG